MYQIDNSTAAATQPASTAPGAPGFFTDGSPAGGVAATIVPAEWLNAVQAELANVVKAAGGTLTKNLFNQIALAIQSCQINYAPDTGTANAYVVTLALPPAALVAGLVVSFQATHANTGASTLNLNGLGAKPILGAAHTALQGNEIVANGFVEVEWNAALASWVLLESTGGALQVATGTQAGQAVNLGQFANSIAASGYTKLPNGLIIQWGPSNFSSTGIANTFPIAFPNNVLAISTGNYGAAGLTTSLSYTATSKTGFTASSSTGAGSYAYIAIGN